MNVRRGQKSMLSVLCHHPLHSLRQGLSLGSGTSQSSWTGWPESPRDPAIFACAALRAGTCSTTLSPWRQASGYGCEEPSILIDIYLYSLTYIQYMELGKHTRLCKPEIDS